MIDIRKAYKTLDARRVRFYADDGVPAAEIHGAVEIPDLHAWRALCWNKNNGVADGGFEDYNLIPVPDWRDEIPWGAFAPWVRFVVRDSDGYWCAKENKPEPAYERGLGIGWCQRTMGRSALITSAINMPAGPDDWREAIAERPEGM